MYVPQIGFPSSSVSAGIDAASLIGPGLWTPETPPNGITRRLQTTNFVTAQLTDNIYSILQIFILVHVANNLPSVLTALIPSDRLHVGKSLFRQTQHNYERASLLKNDR